MFWFRYTKKNLKWRKMQRNAIYQMGLFKKRQVLKALFNRKDITVIQYSEIKERTRSDVSDFKKL
jgi:hypothetical protein